VAHERQLVGTVPAGGDRPLTRFPRRLPLDRGVIDKADAAVKEQMTPCLTVIPLMLLGYSLFCS
jgi:hypothetical protein